MVDSELLVLSLFELAEAEGEDVVVSLLDVQEERRVGSEVDDEGTEGSFVDFEPVHLPLHVLVGELEVTLPFLVVTL